MRGATASALAVVAVSAVVAFSQPGCGGSGKECLVGAVGCPCTMSGGCDPGLTCESAACTPSGEAGNGGGGRGNGGASGASGGRGGAAQGGAGGRGGNPSTGGADGPPAETGTTGAKRPVGAACTGPAECADGLCVVNDGFPGGYCSKTCGGQLGSQGDGCPSGASCVQLNEAASVCLDDCSGATNCRTGYACGERGGASVCGPRCKVDRDCRPGLGCNTVTGLCEPGRRGRGLTGAPCAAASECESNVCITQAEWPAFPGGTCTTPCTAADVGKPCPDPGAFCDALQQFGRVRYTCMQGCKTGVECRPNYFCSAQAQLTFPDGTGICVGKCDLTGCMTGYTCDRSVGNCARTPPPGGAIELQKVDLGTFNVSNDSAAVASFSVEVPGDAVSMTVVAESLTRGFAIGPVKITLPNGKVVFDQADPLATEYREPSAAIHIPMALQFPNSPRLSLTPGTHQFVVGTQRGTTQIKVNAVFKRQAGSPQGGSLPIVLWFTKQNHLDARTAQSDARFQAILSSLARIYEPSGIKLGPFAYRDLSGPEATSLAVIDDTPELGLLYAQASGAQERALHIFLVDQIVLEGGRVIAGQANGIPGPPALPGLPPPGVVLALTYVNAPEFAGIMAHETGHALGLFHTTESSGRTFDPLPDTPECPSSSDRNRDMTVDATECNSAGGNNLMFWNSTYMPPVTLTEDQRFVLLRNANIQ